MARVLLAEASRLTREALERALRVSGFEVTCVSSGREAIQVVRSLPVDHVIVDADLPDMSGIDCIRLLRGARQAAKTTITLLSVSASREQVIEAVRAGANDFLIKCPEIPKALVHRLAAPRPAAAKGAPSDASQDGDAAPEPGGGAGDHAESAAGAAAGTDETPPPPADPETAGDLVASESLSWTESLSKLREMKPLLAKSALLDHIQAEAELRAMSPVARQVLSIASSPTSSIDDVAKVVKQDQAISLKVLRMANSSAFASGRRAESIQKAVARIGLSQIREVVTNIAIIERFSGVGCGGRIRSDWFWEHSIAAGLVASAVARQIGMGPDMADAMFTAGLLHDVGRMLYADLIPDQYVKVMETAETLGLPLEMVESRLLLVNHADVTDRVLRQWKFPPELINPIAFHHLTPGNAARLVPRMVESITVLGLADRLSHALLCGSSGNDCLYLIRDYTRKLGLDTEFVRKLAATVPEETTEMRSVLMLRAGGADPTSFVDMVRARLGGPVRAITVSDDAGSSAVEMFAGRVCADAACEPGIVFVTVHDDHAAHRLEEMVQAAESEAGASGLPVVLFSTPGLHARCATSLRKRRVEMISMPSPVSRIAETVGRLVHGDAAAIAA